MTIPPWRALPFIPLLAVASSAAIAAPSPFVDHRGQEPGKTHLIRPTDLPPPYATPAADNAAKIVARPKDAWPQAPAGFKVELYADGLIDPRLIRAAPNGDVFVVESDKGRVRVLRGLTKDGKAATRETFATGLKQPYGLAFHPPASALAGPPRWVYVANTDSVVRFPYQAGDLKARGPAETVTNQVSGGGRLPGGGHWTRDVAFSLDGKKMYVSVGSYTNIDDPDENPKERDRAQIWQFDSDGKGARRYATGLRNAVGLAVHPRTGVLWASVNERDDLGDNLVPDYITQVKEGGFYGWPWFYIGGNEDPRHRGKHPELKAKVIVPDVLLQPHFASLEMVFYEATQFPPEYKGDLFAAEHGSWNRAVRTGYQVIRVPLHGVDRPTGEYQDFLTGFVTAKGEVWGRPVGVTVAGDGALLVSDDGSKSIWRVTWEGQARPTGPPR